MIINYLTNKICKILLHIEYIYGVNDKIVQMYYGSTFFRDRHFSTK